MTYFIAVLCVFGIALGQILFKISAVCLEKAGSIYDAKFASVFLLALILYGVTTIGWVWVLQKLSLGKVYPLMAFAFVLVPLASHFWLGERFTSQYFVGVTLITIGIVVAVSS